jgi:tetratricopeptide (TPR) repeat protein
VPTPPLWQRPIVAGASLAFYYGKLVAPVRLSFDYGWRPIEMLQRPWFWWLAAIAAMVAIVLFLLRRRSPWLLAGALVSVAALLPVLGLIPFDFQFFSTVADHYMVLAMLGPSIAVAGLLNSQTAMPRLPAIILIAVGSLILGSLSFFQLSHWRTAEDVAEQMVAVTPDSALGHYNLAMIYQAHSDFEDAKIEYIQTETNPFYYLGATNLTILCARMGDPKRAIEAYYKLLLIANRFPPATRPDTPITPYTLAVEANHYHHTADVPLYMLETARMWFAKNFESWLGGPLVKYLPKPYAVPISPEAYRRQK